MSTCAAAQSLAQRTGELGVRVALGVDDARCFAEAVHAHYPDKMLAYNFSPSFNWDTTGLSEEEMTRFPAELGKLGFVFNFITYGGHQIDGLAGIAHRDEINIIERRGNYGWPLAVGAPGADGLVDPILAFIPSAPPADLVFYTAALIPELTGDLFLGSLRAETLMRIRFQDPSDPHRVTAVERWFNTGPRGESVHGRIRSLAVGPEGALYLGTGNRFRGRARQGDDRVCTHARRIG